MAKPTLALIPASQGSKLFSVLPSSGVGDFDFSRGSAATRINSQGLIETVVSGQSRLDYPLIDGKVVGCPHHILEPSRLQLIQYTEAFDNSSWSKSSVGIDTSIGTNGVNPNVAISPDGSLNADRVNFLLQTDFDSGMFDIFAASQNNTYSTSVFLKGEGSNVGKKISIRVKRLSGGTFTSVDTKYTLTDKWVRFELDPITMPSGSTNGIISFTSSEATNCLIYGCQVEQGSYSTSYIPNYGTGSGVTRSAETANGSGDAATFNDSEGVFMVEMSALANDGTFRVISINGTATNVNTNRIQIYFRDTADIITFGMESENSAQFFLQFPLDVKSNNKLALKYSASSCSFWINGIKVGEQLNKVMPTDLIRLDFVRQDGNDEFFYGKTKQIQYYNTVLTDSELEQLTSWISFTDMANGQLYTIE